MDEYKKLERVSRKYLQILSEYRTLIVVTLITYVAANVMAGVVAAFSAKKVIDNLSSGIVGNQTWQLFGLYCLVIVIIRVLFYIGDKFIVFIENKAESKIQLYVFKSLSERNYDFFTNNFSGSLVAKANRFHTSFSGLFDQIALNLLPGLAIIIGIILVVATQNIFLALIFFIWSLLHLWMTIVLIRNKISLSEKTAAEQSRTTGKLSDFLTNAFTAISFAGRSYEIDNFSNAVKKFESRRGEEWDYLVKMFLYLATSVNFVGISTIGFSLFLFSKGSITIGTIFLLFSYSSTIFSQMFAISRGLDRATKNLSDAIEMQEILDSPIKIKDSASATKLMFEKGLVKFNNAVFNYTGEGTDEIDNLDLTIEPGESIGLVGHSGAGKSTIVKLLLRFVDVTGGSITIDGQDIRNVTQESLRKSIGYVPQEPLLFHRTLRENIAYGKPEADIDEVIAAARLANADEFIETLPKGYDTLVGERGVKLSGGQRQRVAIARAILKDAPILILDEATSSLDSKSEHQIQEAIANLIQGKTVIAIAHRLSTIKHLDRIIVLANGTIAEQGSHDYLIAQKGIYADLWQHQQSGFIE